MNGKTNKNNKSIIIEDNYRHLIAATPINGTTNKITCNIYNDIIEAFGDEESPKEAS